MRFFANPKKAPKTAFSGHQVCTGKVVFAEIFLDRFNYFLGFLLRHPTEDNSTLFTFAGLVFFKVDR